MEGKEKLFLPETLLQMLRRGDRPAELPSP
eukprot:SAG31_NODE_37936_length_300_cov_0.776119_1_plen_29_part_10